MTQKQESVSTYIGKLAAELQPVAERVRQAIRMSAPQCVEDIAYGMPTFKLDGHSLIYFAVWKKHIGLYPIYRGSIELESKIARYRAKKDTVQFPLRSAIPYELIADIVASQLSRSGATQPALAASLCEAPVV
jgi:uncharacterized protein YdhG (YjbR/CyaY superfamily)